MNEEKRDNRYNNTFEILRKSRPIWGGYFYSFSGDFSVLKKYPITTDIIVIKADPNFSESLTVKIQNVIVRISAIIPTKEKYIVFPSAFLKLIRIPHFQDNF